MTIENHFSDDDGADREAAELGFAPIGVKLLTAGKTKTGSRRRHRPYDPQRQLKNALNDCAERYDWLLGNVEAFEHRTGMPGAIEIPPEGPVVINTTGTTVAGTIAGYVRFPNGGYRRMTAAAAAAYARMSPTQKLKVQRKLAPTCASPSVGSLIGARYRMVKTPGGTSLRMNTTLANAWRALSPAQQRSLLWRALRYRGTTTPRTLPCR